MTAPLHHSEQPQRGRRRSAQTGLLLVGALSVWVAGACTFQILRAAFAPHVPPSDEACHTGARRLYRAVERARDRAATTSLPERKALARFRADLAADFRTFPSVRQTCKRNGDKQALRALRSIQILRYAEESAVRFSAVDLTHFRRKTPHLVEQLGRP